MTTLPPITSESSGLLPDRIVQDIDSSNKDCISSNAQRYRESFREVWNRPTEYRTDVQQNMKSTALARPRSWSMKISFSTARKREGKQVSQASKKWNLLRPKPDAQKSNKQHAVRPRSVLEFWILDAPFRTEKTGGRRPVIRYTHWHV